MSETTSRKFNLAWHQHEHYWLCIHPRGGQMEPSVQSVLSDAGLGPVGGNKAVFGIQTGKQWKPVWERLHALLAPQAQAQLEVSLTPGGEPPHDGSAQCMAFEGLQSVADNMWLGDALLEGRILCYLQPVLSNAEKVFGYESFARVVSPDGSVIGGDRIVMASKALGIEYMIDRHLQVQAIKTFMSSEFNGYLFINFFPGFIHRPSVYMEGLAETVKNFGILPRHIVLDFTKSESPHDIMHLKNVCEYGRSCGYSIALDDIESVKSVQRLYSEIRPDFVKIDMQLVHKVAEPQSRDTIREIVELVHASGGSVIGEGVETDAMYQSLKLLDVDLFQGYLFSPPVPVDVALKRSAN